MGQDAKSMQIRTKMRESEVVAWFAGAMLVTSLVAACRVIPLGPPMIFADEYVYASWSNYLVSGVSPELPMYINNWLYYQVYSITSWGAGDPEVKARLLNVFFCMASLPAMYSITMRLVRPRLAALVAAAVCGFGMSNYAAYFMPESMFFFAALVAFAFLLNFLLTGAGWSLAAAAIAQGALVAIKPHGLFIYPIGVVLLAWASMFAKRDILVGWRHVAQYAVIPPAVFVCLNSLISGHLVINPFSGSYTQSQGSGSLLTLSMVVEVAGPLGRHLGVIALIGAYPLLLAAWQGWRVLRRTSGDREAFPMGLFVLYVSACLFCTVFITAAFTAMAAKAGGYESAMRMHGRYYEPYLLFFLFMTLLLPKSPFAEATLLRKTATFLIVASLAILGYAATSRLPWSESIDFSLANALIDYPFVRYNFLIAALLSAAAAIYVPGKGRLAPIAVMVIYLMINSRIVDVHRLLARDTLIDTVSKAMEESEIPNHYVLVKQMDADAYRAAYYQIGHGRVIQQNATLACGRLPERSVVMAIHGIDISCGSWDVRNFGSGVKLAMPRARDTRR